jgi:hypothetical protein
MLLTNSPGMEKASWDAVAPLRWFSRLWIMTVQTSPASQVRLCQSHATLIPVASQGDSAQTTHSYNLCHGVRAAGGRKKVIAKYQPCSSAIGCFTYSGSSDTAPTLTTVPILQMTTAVFKNLSKETVYQVASYESNESLPGHKSYMCD